MSKKIILTIGISGSGKSTFVHEQWKTNPTGIVVINRDKIRELLFSYSEGSIKGYYSRPDISKLEKQVTKYEDTLIHEALMENKTVAVDATHLKKEFLERFKYWNVPIEYKYFDISLETAIERDSKRNRSVGAEVIKRQHNQYLELQRQGIPVKEYEPVLFENDSQLPPCILLDLDGTIAHMTDRSPFDWKRVGEDYVDSVVKAVTNAIYLNHTANIVVCTGRDGSCLKESVDWLNSKGIYFDKIFIRKEGDQRPDYVIKEELWRDIAKNYYILGLIDDRNQVVRRARALGLKVFQVEYANF